MSPEMEVQLFENIKEINSKVGKIEERTEATNKIVEHLRDDISDIYGENKADRDTCAVHRAEINAKIEAIKTIKEKEDRAARFQKKEDYKWMVGTRWTAAGILLTFCVSVAALIAGVV